MMVSKWGALGGVLLLAAPVVAPARVVAQDRDSIVRTLDVFRGTQIGASVSDADEDDAKASRGGVTVDSVTPGGPADKAGIKAGDTITEFDGERVRSVRQFSRLVQESAPGRSVPVALARGGQKVNVTVTPERRSSGDFDTRLFELPRVARPITPAPPALPRAARPTLPELYTDRPGILRLWNTHGIGITIESIDDQLAAYFGVKEGVLVKSVLDDSPAQRAGLKAGDVITSFNGSKIYDTSDLTRAIDRLEANAEFSVEVTRDKKTQTLKGKFDSEPRRRSRGVRTIL